MKKILALLLTALLLVLPLSGGTAAERSLELTHETALFDMGVTHAAAITASGDGYAWGYNYNGAIGNGHLTGVCPEPYNWGSNAAQVSVNAKTTLMIDRNGVLWIWGETWWGIGGEPMPSTGIISEVPVQVASNVRCASMGFNHIVFVKNDNTLWVYGQNTHGQLGNNTTNNNYTPTQVLTNVAYAAAGDCLTAAVKTDGTLWVWGYNASGQVGNNSTADRKTPVQVLTNVYTVSTMGDHVMAVKNDGTLWAWGDNTYGQLGKGNTSVQRTPVQVMTDVAQVSAGSDHTGVIKTDGTLWFCGRNYMGPFGNGTTSGYSAANPTFRQTPGSYLYVKCGSRLTGVVKDDGVLYVAGDNTYGQLGLGFTDNPDGTRFFSTFTPTSLHILGSAAIPGDVNCDGAVTFADVSVLQARVLNQAVLSEQGEENADMNGDGSLTSIDITLLYKKILNK